MKVGLVRIYVVLACLLSAIIVPAQELPLMPQDAGIKCCVLPNGLSCYVAVNRSSKGMADFAVFKRDYSGNDQVCIHEDVLVNTEVAIDSTLISLMRQIADDKIPADQAVVICGDVDASSVITRLRYMSLMIDSSAPSACPEYVWDESSKVVTSCIADTIKGLSTLRFQWYAPRPSVKYMNTVQSVVYDKTVWELGDVVCRWIKRELRMRDVPVADVSYSHSGSTDGFSHEKFTVEVTVRDVDAQPVGEAVTSILSALDSGKVPADDLSIAEKEYYQFLGRYASEPVIDNADYVKVCRDAYLYNRPLVLDKDRLSFFMSKDISESSRAKIFSRIVSAMLDVDNPSDTVELHSPQIMLSDTLGLPGLSPKVKVRNSKKDPLSGSYQWTFANGIRVIYKKMPTGRDLYYSLSMKGGFGEIENLKRGQGAYISDYMDCCWIAGMKSSYFKNLLKLSGMSMNTHVGLFNTEISGKVSDRNASLMMKSLLAVTNAHSLDAEEAEYYIRSERLRQKMFPGEDVRVAVDSVICPGFRYTSFKTKQGIQEDTFLKAEKFFTDLTSQINDGVLVIVGDMDENELRKLLQVYVGGFKVKEGASRRPSMSYHPVSGWSSYVVEGSKDAAVAAISGRMPMTSSNYFASELAAILLERNMKKAFEGRGVKVRLSYSRGIYPDERFSVMFWLDGPCTYMDMDLLKMTLSECSENVDASEMAACKEYMKNAYSLQMQTPDYWLRAIPLRHLEGKDYTSGYVSKIDAVSAEQVKAVLKVLEDGAGVEYIINNTR